MLKKTGSRGESRSSALWGTGNRGGESRSNALWGKGGRGAITTVMSMLVLAAPLAASADRNDDGDRHLSGRDVRGHRSYVDPELLEQAQANPERLLRVIIQSKQGVRGARNAFDQADGLDSTSDREALKRRLSLVGATAVTVKAKKLGALARMRGLSITPDTLVRLAGIPTSKHLWPTASNIRPLWSERAAYDMPTIAIVDSGIDAIRPDFDMGGRVIHQEVITTLQPNSPGDGRGHGTFVAGIAAGSADGNAGAAPGANIVSVDVMNDDGMALTSEVIKGAEWIYENRKALNIRVANFSLHATRKSNFTRDPLDRAVEKLWFGGVVVVVAAGNYGVPNGPSGVMYAPGNDPFVITVGAIDMDGTVKVKEHEVPSWSAYGYTYDGFLKPEIAAAGRFMVGAVPLNATLKLAKPNNIVSPTSMKLSGTSFAAPIVTGAAAQILARHPEYTPDQVKGALMVTARYLPEAPPKSAGVGEVNAQRAATRLRAPNPNHSLNRYLVPDPLGGGVTFDAASWESAAMSSVSWDSASWSDASWNDASWQSASWNDVSWNDASWHDVATGDSLAEADNAFEDNADLEIYPLVGGEYVLTALEEAAAASDPDLAPVELPQAIAPEPAPLPAVP